MAKKEDKIEKLIHRCLMICHIHVSDHLEKLLVQIFKFAIVGVFATLIDFAFLYIFKEYCHFPTILANTLSFVISVLYNYWASIRWVFDVNKEKDAKRNFILFVITSAIGLLINDIIMYIVSEVLLVHYMLAKIAATAVVMVFNFITRKKFLE